MAVEAAPHFVQACDGPVFIGHGTGTLACACGQVLIQDYDPSRFLCIAIQCGACGQVTETPGLPDDAAPPQAVVVAEAVAEPRTATMPLPPTAVAIGRGEMDRITALYQPVNPSSNIYAFDPALLDKLEQLHQQHSGTRLPRVTADPAGLRDHALAWAIAHLRDRMRQDDWTCLEAPATSAACCHAAGFLHFVATWGHHPVFPAMAATATESGFSLHGLAPFAAAHALATQGNRVAFPKPEGYPGRIRQFSLALGPRDSANVITSAFERFDWPTPRAWDPAALRAAVLEAMGAEQARINPRNPGLLVLSLGPTLAGFDEALIRAAGSAMDVAGRRQKGLMAVAPVALRLYPAASPRQVQFGHGLFPIRNRHFRGGMEMRDGAVA